jgi:hypothetical protein
MVQSLFDRLGIKQWVNGLAFEPFKGLINSWILLFLSYEKIQNYRNNENNCERNFAKNVEILNHQMAGQSSKQTSNPLYHIRD